ncbi:hypothetical protein F4808DRAFT_133572 [Astrocystis sublimbata]|nr:hypothetical protein F4808DRAFT_133572 [Astrocystis sublimbata]
MANDSRPAASKEPAESSNGARAALLAAKSATGPGALKHSVSTSGASAAASALKASRSTRSTTARNTNTGSPGSATLDRHRSLLAAQGAVARRQRADSTPILPKESYPDEANAAANALNAATVAHRPAPKRVPREGTGAVPYTTLNKLMFTSQPPVKPEVDEQQRADVLHASAIAMAKKMYSQQQKMIEAKKDHIDEPSGRGNLEVSSSVSDDTQPAQLTTLQDAAYKQAQARLAKMQEENAQNRKLGDYYGTTPLSTRRSIRGKLRKRSLSDGVVIDDKKRSQQIKKQMSLFSNKLSEIDEHKRQQDKDLLLAAAQRNVHERLKGMDAKIASETGMVPPSTLTQWELNARVIAQSRALQQVDQHEGKVDLGAGVHMDQDEINAIAARRIQPILDEINAKAELEHARQLELKLEMERKKEEQETEKARQKEFNDIQKKLKEQSKQEQKEKKAEEKAAKAEQKRLSRADKTRSVEQPRDITEPESGNTTNGRVRPISVPVPSTQKDRGPASPATSLEGSPKSPSGKLKNWIKSRFSRSPKSPTAEEHSNKGKETDNTGFVGGVALTGSRSNKSTTSFGPDLGAPISPLSTESGSEISNEDLGRGQPQMMLTPPRPVTVGSSARLGSPARDSRFHEIIE